MKEFVRLGSRSTSQQIVSDVSLALYYFLYLCPRLNLCRSPHSVGALGPSLPHFTPYFPTDVWLLLHRPHQDGIYCNMAWHVLKKYFIWGTPSQFSVTCHYK